MEDRQLLVYEAANRNDLNGLEKALTGAYGKVLKEDLDLALLRAAANGHLDCLKLIMKFGPDINAVDGQMKTALIYATKSQDLEMMQCLMQAGCDVNAKTTTEVTALCVACRSSNIAAIELLLSHGARTDGFFTIALLQTVVLWGNMAAIKKILSLGIDKKELSDVLPLAVQMTTKDVVDVVLKAGADVNNQSWYLEDTPLISAIKFNRVEMVKHLLKCGADVNMTCELDRTPLHYAARAGKAPMLNLLLEAGADKNALTSTGKSPFHIAIVHLNYEALNVLLRVGCNVERFNIGGEDYQWDVISLYQITVISQNAFIFDLLHQVMACNLGYLYESLLKVQHEVETDEAHKILQQLEKFTKIPNSLTGLCRKVIRRAVQEPFASNLQSLPLPNILLEYLQFSDIFTGCI